MAATPFKSTPKGKSAPTSKQQPCKPGGKPGHGMSKGTTPGTKPKFGGKSY